MNFMQIYNYSFNRKWLGQCCSDNNEKAAEKEKVLHLKQNLYGSLDCIACDATLGFVQKINVKGLLYIKTDSIA